MMKKIPYVPDPSLPRNQRRRAEAGWNSLTAEQQHALKDPCHVAYVGGSKIISGGALQMEVEIDSTTIKATKADLDLIRMGDVYGEYSNRKWIERKPHG